MKWILGILCLAAAVALPLLLTACQSENEAAAPSNIDTPQGLFEAVARTYQSAPAFTDTVTVNLPGQGGEQTMTFELLAGANGNARLTALGHNFLAVDGQLYLSRESRPNKVVRLPLADGRLLATDPIGTLRLPQLALRYGTSSEEYLKGIGMGLVEDLHLTGRESVQIDGTALDALLFNNNDDATVRVLIDPRTKLIKSVTVDSQQGAFEFRMNPAVYAEAPREIVYDPSKHREVPALAQLALGEGDAAPDFTLSTLDDQAVTLSDLGGSVVVLDFWATWCGPCRMSLPKLQEFATWAEQEGVAVKVFAVDMGERVRTNEEKRRKVRQFWQRQGFTMPTLMDYDSKVAKAFEVGSIPHTVVIGPDGKLWKVHIGFNPGMVEVLKRETAQALAEAD